MSPPHCIVIVGMHRAGTSLVAKMFYEWGVNLGDRLMESDPANEGGYWENWDFVEHSSNMMAQAKTSWNYPKMLDDQSSVGKSMHLKAGELIRNNTRHLWGWKDNRTAFTFPVYKPWLMDQKVLFVVCHRDRKAVIASLFRTHIRMFEEQDKTEEYLGKLYDLHYSAIDEISKDYPRVDIRYEDLVDNKFFKPELRHF